MWEDQRGPGSAGRRLAAPSDGVASGRPALFLGHPGHELCIHGWLGRARPFMFVLTDGSGGASTSRLDWTTRLLRDCGAEPQLPYGAFTDADVYRALLTGRDEGLLALAESLAEALLRLEPSYLVCDPADGYNPSHDLCRLLAGAALERVRRVSGRFVPLYEYRLLTDPEAVASTPGPGWERLELNPDEVERKVRAARAYLPLRREVEGLLARCGPEALRCEWFLPVAPPFDVERGPDSPPSYEAYGAERVAGGRYTEVLRYREHVLPFQERLRGRLRRGAA